MKIIASGHGKGRSAQCLAPAISTFFAFLLASASCWGQQVTAAITGKVTDQTGAALVKAKVTATDTERRTACPTITNSAGVYNLPHLPIPTHHRTTELPAFQPPHHPNSPPTPIPP